MRIKKKSIVKGILIALLVMVIGSIGIFSYILGKSIGGGMLQAESEADTRTNSIKQLEAWGYDWVAFETQYLPEEVELIASDGQKIPGYYYTMNGDKYKDTALLVHGMGGEALCMAPITQMYLQQDMNVFVVDRRGTGKVKDGQLTYGYDEKKDLEACVEYLRAKMGDRKLIIHGQSLGGTVVGVYAETEHAKKQVDGFILECPMKSLRHMLLMVWQPESKIIEDYGVACGSLYLKVKEGFTFQDIDLIEGQHKNQIATLVIGATKDELCTPAESEAIFNQIGTQNKKYCILDSEHVEGYLDHPDEYTKNIMAFIKDI
ncbi:MAG: alpha/beta hydrolase [Cellulosilyticum sp.]|nr:alpha/beta hydrolase [Cellulosilyticum sp.]